MAYRIGLGRIGLGALLVSVSALVLWLVHDRIAAGRQTSFLEWRDSRTVRAGEALYRAHCAACHGVPGVSAPVAQAPGQAPAPAHDASGHTWEHPDFALFQLIRDGVAVANCTPVDPELMPAFRGVVSDAELVAILSYVKSTWPEDIRAHHDRVNVMYGPYNRAVGELIGAGRSAGEGAVGGAVGGG